MQTLANGKTLGAYTIVRLIGRGGMGEVYEAYEHRLQRKVALKVIAPQKADIHGESELVRRFMQEARTLAQVNHPNVVTIYSIDKIGDVQFIAMEYVEGSAFKDIFSLFALSADEAAPIFLQLLEGLRSLHEMKILHRDLKPHNIMIRPNGTVKILDFGIAKRLNDRERENTTVGVVVGTLAYLPPEVLYGVPATSRSDLWSMGAIFYECMVGQPLVSIHSVKVKGVRAATDSDVVFPQEVLGWIPQEMRAIVGKMSDRKPENRYASADEVIEAIKHYQHQRPALSATKLTPLLSIVSDLEGYKKTLDVKKVSNPEAKRAQMLTLLNGRHVSAESGSLNAADETLAVPVEVTKDSISARQKSRRRKRKPRLEWLWPLAGVGAVISALLLAAVVVKTVKVPKPTAEHAKPTPTETVSQTVLKLISPSADQALWLDPTQIPTLTWSKAVGPGDYELQIASDPDFNNIVIREEASGTSYRPARMLGEGDYHWQLWPIRRALKPVGPVHFTLSTTTPVDLSWPKADQTFEIRRGSKMATVSFTWKCKPGGKSYRVQISTDTNFLSSEREEVTELCTWSDVKLPAATYFWRVRVEEPAQAQNSTLVKQSFLVRGENRVAEPVSSPPSPTSSSPSERLFAAPKIKNSSQTVLLQVKDGAQGRDLASLRKMLATVPQMQWQAVKGAKAYNVQISWNQEFSKLLTEETVTKPQLIWSQPTPGQFYWRVRVAGEAPGPYSAAGQLDIHLPEPKVAAKSNGKVEWKPIPFADEYIVQTSPERSMASVSEKVTASPMMELEAPEKGGPLFVRVAAANAAGVKVGGYSPVVVVNIEAAVKLIAPGILTPPRGAKVSAPKTGLISVVFTWTKEQNATDYLVQVSDQADFAKVLQEKTVKAPHWILKGAKFNGKIYWRVRGQAESGPSPWSKPGFFEVH